ncbi:AAA domain (dynein-related subfamily) [Chryseobacterium taeanense]|uniref:AAA domain (Dynein-related subfamily) n=1 Tax=Chryseobacterium taeanense TaxID=311334 RepID=A0A1G8FSP6_9FLAO|nr:AAA family ATPase [Chryseobacterium taeanense]SDH85182.1 AAA domain (dynein-related subfamily) [Chryseobacterium taeanense]
MNQELFQKKWNQYKEEFFKDSSIYDEKYKWDVLKQVSDKWNWNVDDKITMFKEAFEVKGRNNLWTSINYYPTTMATWFFNDFPDETLAAFENLFNEETDLLTRLNDFKKYFDNQLTLLQDKYPDKKLNYHSQDIRSMSLYLFLQNPSKYSLFKFSFVKNFADQLGMGFIRKGQNHNYIIYLEILNQIKEIILSDPFIQQYRQYNTENNLYTDESLHLLIQDFMYCSVTYNHTSEKRYWLYSPGESAYKWDEFYDLGIMALGWDELQDLNSYSNGDEIKKALYDAYGGNENKSNATIANDEFINSMNIGDIIIVKKGRKQLMGFGEVSSDYYYDADREDYKHARKVEWKKKGEWNIDQHMVVKTLTDITGYDSGLDDGKKYYEYLLSMMDNNLTKYENEHIINLLQYKKQIILQGPPGTGKTREAKSIAQNMLGLDEKELQKSEQFKIIQFHPSYTYEDFVRGIVAESKGDKIEYKNVNKILGEFADAALKNYLDSKKIPEQVSKENWVNTQYVKFKESIQKEIETDNEVLIKEGTKPKITFVEDDSLRVNRYSNENDSVLVKDSDIINGYIGLYLSEMTSKIRNNELLSKSARSGMYYLYQNLVEKFKKYLDENNLQYSTTNETKKIEKKNYILIIDEINRANLSSVLGELIYALEYRGEEVESMYSVDDSLTKNKLILPPNLYIIGTMNTADRSVGHIDYAIRRRFAFVDIIPKDLTSEMEEGKFYTDLFSAVKALFTENEYETKSDFISQEFEPKDVALGHSYFIDKSEEGGEMKVRWNYEIKPILLEYVRDGVLKADALGQINEIENQFTLKIE